MHMSKPMKGEVNENGELVISEIDIKKTITESFNGEEGLLEIFKGVYKHAKGGSVPHAQFIMKYWLEEGDGEEIKKFLFSEEVIE